MKDIKKICVFLFLVLLTFQVQGKDRQMYSFQERLDMLKEAKSREKMRNKKTASEISQEVVKLLNNKGASGVDELKGKVSGQDKEMIAREQGVTPPRDFQKMKALMLKNEGPKKITPMPERYQNKMNGNMERESFRIEYEDGSVQIMNLKYIKPTISGGMELMEVTVE